MMEQNKKPSVVAIFTRSICGEEQAMSTELLQVEILLAQCGPATG